MSEAEILRATMGDRLNLYRENTDGEQVQWEQVYSDLPCALSRYAALSSPSPPGEMEVMAQNDFRMTLFLPVGCHTKSGDKAQVVRYGQKIEGTTSQSFAYHSHSVCVLHCKEVHDI